MVVPADDAVVFPAVDKAEEEGDVHEQEVAEETEGFQGDAGGLQGEVEQGEQEAGAHDEEAVPKKGGFGAGAGGGQVGDADEEGGQPAEDFVRPVDVADAPERIEQGSEMRQVLEVALANPPLSPKLHFDIRRNLQVGDGAGLENSPVALC